MASRPALVSEFLTWVDIWELSVKATHDFLPDAFLMTLRQTLNERVSVSTVALTDANDTILGFAGTSDDTQEMLTANGVWETPSGRLVSNRCGIAPR